MRILLVLRGNYYAGQEEFIKNNKLQNYTLDLNALRLLSGSVKNIVSEYKILNVKNDEDLSKILLKLLEMRMQKGEFCIINAYNETLKIYKDLAKQYRYKMYVIVFDSSLKQCQEKNLLEAKKMDISSLMLFWKKLKIYSKKSKKIPNFRLERLEKMSLPNANLSKYKKFII